MCKRETMQDFLTFQTFITPTLLIIMYYIGALVIPLLCWYLVHWIKKVYISEKVKTSVVTHTTARQRIIMFSIFFICFLFMEVLWRMIFEFLIAYFDMHDALMKLT